LDRVTASVAMVVVCATSLFGVTQSEVRDQLRSSISDKVARQLNRFSDVDLTIDIRFPDQSGTLLASAVTTNVVLSDYGNYVGRSVIPIGLVDAKRRIFSTVKAVVDVTAVGGYVISSHVIQKGHQLSTSDVVVHRGVVNDISRQAFGDVSQVLGKETVATVSDGVPLTQTTIREVPDIRRGDSVWVDYRNGAIQLKVPGEALSDGRIGDRLRIRLKLDSHKVMEGKIVDSTTVRVSATY